jgi:hypothetical protein
MPRGERPEFELLGRQTDVFHVEPDTLKPAGQAEDMDQVVMKNAADPADEDMFAFGQSLFEGAHGGGVRG